MKGVSGASVLSKYFNVAIINKDNTFCAHHMHMLQLLVCNFKILIVGLDHAWN